MTADPYHPRFPSIDKDFFERLTDNASRMANPFRLAMFKYTEAQEIAIAAHWEKRRDAARK